MKKIVLLLTTTLLLTAGWAMAQNSSLSFNDNGLGGGTATTGTYNSTDTFNFDVFLTWSGAASDTGTGLSYWLQTETGVAPNITISGETLFTWTPAQDSQAKPWTFTDTAGALPGFIGAQSATQTGDLGGADAGAPQVPGTYKVSNVVFSLAGAAPGTYHLELMLQGDPNNSKQSEMTRTGTDDFFTTRTIYTFTIVPEPATWSLFGLGGLGTLGLTWLRARKRI